MTASAHIITAVIGSGVLSLAWAIAQMGWVAGPAVLFAFSFITYFTSTLLADSYRFPDPVHGKRNYTYSDVVRATLGNKQTNFLTYPNNTSRLLSRYKDAGANEIYKFVCTFYRVCTQSLRLEHSRILTLLFIVTLTIEEKVVVGMGRN